MTNRTYYGCNITYTVSEARLSRLGQYFEGKGRDFESMLQHRLIREFPGVSVTITRKDGKQTLQCTYNAMRKEATQIVKNCLMRCS